MSTPAWLRVKRFLHLAIMTIMTPLHKKPRLQKKLLQGQ